MKKNAPKVVIKFALKVHLQLRFTHEFTASHFVFLKKLSCLLLRLRHIAKFQKSIPCLRKQAKHFKKIEMQQTHE